MVKFKNPWERPEGENESTNADAKFKVLKWGPDHWQNSEDNDMLANQNNVLQKNNWLKYTVKKGESFDSISTKFGIPGGGEDLAFNNNMDYSDPRLPTEGSVILLYNKDEEYLDKIEEDLDTQTKLATYYRFYVAVDNLIRFRLGRGGIKILEPTWLKKFNEVTSAMEDIQGHFEDALNTIAEEMDSGETVTGDGTKKEKGNQYWWEGFINPSYIFSKNELSYACGASTLTGIGKIDLARDNNDIITISGEVTYEFYDLYDWHGGNSVPAMAGLFYDSDMLLLIEYRGAKEFLMKSSWKQKLSGTIEIDTFSPNEINLTWTDL